MAKQIELIYGVVRIGNSSIDPEESTDEAALKIFELLKKHKINYLDTSRLYGNSETALGLLKAGTDHGFKIGTKWYGGFFDPTSITKERIISDAQDSLSKLGVRKVYAFCLHSPFVDSNIEETLAAINEAYKMDIFEHFGLSNFTPAQVQQVYDVCKAEGFVLPTVYEGLYNPVNRKPEEELIPLLRKLGVAFHAYSPLAGGFLTKTRQDVVKEQGRFAKDQYRGLYREMYNNEPFLEAQDEWGRIAEEEHVTKMELAYRWMCYHSSLKAEFGDGVIIGGRLEQLEETIESVHRGELSEHAVKKIQELWEKLQPNVKYLHNLQAMQ
jgi:aflatoxin B1 aldehyde reductase